MPEVLVSNPKLRSKMINTHTHIFTEKNVPVNFLPWFIKPIANFVVKKWMVKLLKWLRLTSEAYLVNKFRTFKKISELTSQEKVFEHLTGFYPQNAAFVTLSMDMEYMGAGRVPDSFTTQLDQLAQLKTKFPDKIYPFVFAHPERPDVFDLVQKYIEEHQFAGIKMHPALGYFPHDPRLEKVYEYAEKNELPIMSHCTRGGVFYKGKLTTTRRTDPRTGVTYPKQSNGKFTDVYSDPSRYDDLLSDFPKLKLCFAHFGGASEWDKFLQESWHDKIPDNWFFKIKERVSDTRFNAYTDISYTLADPKYYATLKAILLSDSRLQQRVLFGTDYYMTEQEVSERAFGLNLRGFLGEDLWNQIAVINPEAYLKSTFNQL